MNSVTVNKAALKAALVTVTKVTGTTAWKPILQNVKVTAIRDYLLLRATDLEVHVRLHLDAQIQGVMELLVNAKQLADVVRHAAGKDVTLTQEGKILKIAGVELDASDDLGEFPVEPEVKPMVSAKHLTGEELANMYRRTSFAVAKGMSCYAYNGLRFESSGRMVAADGHRLAISNASKDMIGTWSAILVAKGVELAAKVFAKDTLVHIVPNDKQVQFKGVNGSRVTVRQLEGDFPRYLDAIPDSFAWSVTVSRTKFEEAIKQATTLNKKIDGGFVTMTFDSMDNTMYLETTVKGVGSMHEWLTVHGDQVLSGFNVTLNPDFVLDWLKSLKKIDQDRFHDTIELFFQAEKLGSLSCTNAMKLQDTDDRDQVYILMPFTEK